MKGVSKLSIALLLGSIIFEPLVGLTQIPVADVIKQGITKAIKAVDLEVQRLQTKTIWLQNAQKIIENDMSRLHLNEITDWAQKQKDLYSDYYNELTDVKSAITLYHGVQDIYTKQAQLFTDYKRTWQSIQQDKHFTISELHYMSGVYSSILEQTVENVDALLLVINSFVTQMPDAKRIELINSIAEKVNQNYSDLHRFNNQNAMLSLQRAKDETDIGRIKTMYGL